MTHRRLILVTGAPRTATTPVGNLLAQCRGAVSLYEPLGPTGLSWIRDVFPMVGEGLGIEPDELGSLICQLRALRIGKLKPQSRHHQRASLRSIVLGSRTLHSLRLARLQPWSRTVIWKDPHAILMIPDLIDRDVHVVVTARTPWAHAASYKRLGWHSRAAEIYPRWSRKYGPCSVCEKFLKRHLDSVVTAALLWRLSYLPLVRTGALADVLLITSADLERDQRGTYLKLIRELGLTPTSAVHRTLSRRGREAEAAVMSPKTHDWKRSIASVNRYWQEILTTDEVETVRAITDDLTPHVFGATA